MSGTRASLISAMPELRRYVRGERPPIVSVRAPPANLHKRVSTAFFCRGKVSVETIRNRIVDAVPPAHHVHAGDTPRARRAEPDESAQPGTCKQPCGLRGFC